MIPRHWRKTSHIVLCLSSAIPLNTLWEYQVSFCEGFLGVPERAGDDNKEGHTITRVVAAQLHITLDEVVVKGTVNNGTYDGLTLLVLYHAYPVATEVLLADANKEAHGALDELIPEEGICGLRFEGTKHRILVVEATLEVLGGQEGIKHIFITEPKGGRRCRG